MRFRSEVKGLTATSTISIGVPCSVYRKRVGLRSVKTKPICFAAATNAP